MRMNLENRQFTAETSWTPAMITALKATMMLLLVNNGKSFKHTNTNKAKTKHYLIQFTKHRSSSICSNFHVNSIEIRFVYE